MALTSKETEFCRIYVSTGNSREAAARAGYAFPEKSGLKLLSRDCIVKEIERLSESAKISAEATDGLRRIAFGSVTDAIRLILGAEDIDDPEELDLFMISEIKMPKSGGLEIKFFDRIKALEALAGLSENGTTEGAAPFINAIFKGAKAITDIERSEDDEL